MNKIVVLTTGGTIAGRAASPDRAASYRAGVVPAADLLAPFADAGIECVEVAAVDSKDMDAAIWQQLLRACAAALARPDVRGVVITHGTDTAEETAFFLEQALRCAPDCANWAHKPLTLTCAMRPVNALLSDGPQNLSDAMAWVRSSPCAGIALVCAGKVHAAQAVHKIHPWRLDPFSSGDEGVLGLVEDGRIRVLRLQQERASGGDSRLWQALMQIDPQQWPWVEIVHSHAGSTGQIVRALQQAGVHGLVIAGTGNATVHGALERALRPCIEAGLPVWRSTVCQAGRVIASENSAAAAADMAPVLSELSPVKARIRLMLDLLARQTP